jgi:phage shock protein A
MAFTDTAQEVQTLREEVTTLRQDVATLKQQVIDLQAWQNTRNVQQIQFPLDRASTQIIASELGL